MDKPKIGQLAYLEYHDTKVRLIIEITNVNNKINENYQINGIVRYANDDRQSVDKPATSGYWFAYNKICLYSKGTSVKEILAMEDL